jgi:hypothetical protein
MQTNGSFINNSNLAALAQKAAPAVVHAIKQAAQATGVNFAYLMEQAAAESSFKADAKAKGSSASGLYQFIERTWMTMVREHGDKYGLGDLAEKIDARGRVTDKTARKEILALRNDPEVAALMAGELAAENQRYLEQYGGKIGDIGSTELYFAHFLGASGAAGFLKAHKNNPLAIAADIAPDAARSNYNVFYNSKTGKARTVAEVYAFFDKKFSASKGDVTFSPAIANAAPPAQGDDTPAQRMAAGQADLYRARERSAPVLPEYSPFAHLNTRNENTQEQQEQQQRDMRAYAAELQARGETIQWNGARTILAAPQTGANLDPSQIVMLASLSSPRFNQ